MDDLERIIERCKEAMESQFYSLSYRKGVYRDIERIREWFKITGEGFCESSAERMLEESFGECYAFDELECRDRSLVRTLRKLVSLQEKGQLGYRCIKIFRPNTSGSIGDSLVKYERYSKNSGQKEKTTNKKVKMLSAFNDYMSQAGNSLSRITPDTVLGFINSHNWSEGHRYWVANTLRDFLEFSKDLSGQPEGDLEVLVPKIRYTRKKSLPTTYTEEEIRRILAVIDRSSSIGKRNYLAIALAVTYGWRVADIVGLQFKHIDWKSNVIAFHQQKTGNMLESPLLPHIGNAIIDYIRNGRPETDSPCIIVAHLSAVRGQPLSEGNINMMIRRCMIKAGIEGWQEKKHGPHSLRHSLATNMLSDGTPIPVISNILGHENVESTKTYLSLDAERLRLCAIPVPSLDNHRLFRRSI